MTRAKPRADWTRLNEKLWERSAGACERCGRFLASPERAERHHRKLRSGQGADNLANLVLLCANCHTTASPTSVHSNVAEARRMGFIVTRAGDPSLVPIRHALHGWVVLSPDGQFTPSLFPIEDAEEAA